MSLGHAQLRAELLSDTRRQAGSFRMRRWSFARDRPAVFEVPTKPEALSTFASDMCAPKELVADKREVDKAVLRLSSVDEQPLN